MIGNQNILQSLKTLDPAFHVLESKEYGSDPNRLPDIEIRGKSSIVGLKEEYGQDPNQPLFILDGFETTLQVIMDLNIDRVASVTIFNGNIWFKGSQWSCSCRNKISCSWSIAFEL